MNDWRRGNTTAYRRVNRPLALLGLMCVLAGIRFFFDPSAIEDTAIGQQVSGPIDELWSGCFLIGGVLLVYGTQRPDPRMERAGLYPLIAAIALQGFATAILVGLDALVSLILYVLVLYVFIERVTFLTRLDRRAAENET